MKPMVVASNGLKLKYKTPVTIDREGFLAIAGVGDKIWGHSAEEVEVSPFNQNEEPGCQNKDKTLPRYAPKIK